MKKILFTASDGLPNLDSGGSNKVIYLILKYLNHNHFTPYFLSYGHFLNPVSYINGNIEIKAERNLKKKITNRLFEKLKMYRTLTTSTPYMHYYFRKRDNYFNNHFRAENYSLIHCHHALAANNFNNFNGRKILTIHNKGSFVYDLMNNNPTVRYSGRVINELKKIEKKAVESSDIITFPSKAALDYFDKDTEGKYLNKKNIEIIYNGIDYKSIGNKELNPNILNKYSISQTYDKVLFNVANHTKPKNIELLIESMNIIVNEHKNNFLLLNAGWGSDTKNYFTLLDKYNLADNVKFLGKISNTDIISIMKMCDIYIMVSEKVIFDYVILEALAAGCCVLATNVGGNKEIINHGTNGYLIEQSNCQSIVELIYNYNPKVKKNTVKTLSNFSINKMISDYERLYLKLV